LALYKFIYLLTYLLKVLRKPHGPQRGADLHYRSHQLTLTDVYLTLAAQQCSL